MVEELRRLIGDGPYPEPETDNSDPVVSIYHGAGAAVVKSNKEIFLPKGVHAHSSYEFAIPYTNMPPSYAGRRIVNFDKNKLLPFNVNQEHGLSVASDKCSVLSIQISQSILSNMAYYICGKNEVIFQNEAVIPDNEYLQNINRYMEEITFQQAGYEFVTQGLVSQIAVSLLRQLKSNISSFINECKYDERKGINRAISFLRENYNKEYSLEDVAQEANLSPYHFIRVFKLATGKTPYDYFLDIKVEKACLLLKNKKVSVTEACFLCGFNNLEHFASVFKRKMGMLPSQYRKLFND